MTQGGKRRQSESENDTLNKIPKTKSGVDGVATEKNKNIGSVVGEIKESHTIYINNLPDKTRLENLKSNLYLICSTYGEVIDIRVGLKLRGQAFVTFSSVDEAKSALKALQGDLFDKKPMKVAFSKHESKIVTN